MFYSQFILAKKGPLGTIWIAAHLERKLRKNQVADTDIGISVDSILFPDVPIALRLSSHLLLGVVRIYSRKVNYLFDDCSEALLKVKQAFRSTAVDLPPEESTAPYNSITLPETFDLDDFELPDNEIFQGNYVDQHVSSREQITLQDTMDGVAYSTSQFGLEERFGDGETSQIGLDLEEDMFLDKAAAQEDGRVSEADEASVQTKTPLEKDKSYEGIYGTSAIMISNGLENQDPFTSKLVDEANLANIQGDLACNDQLELKENNSLNSIAMECSENASNKSGQDLGGNNLEDGSLGQKLNHNSVADMHPEYNGHLSSDMEIKQVKPDGCLASNVLPMENVSAENDCSISLPSDVVELIKPFPLPSECSDGTTCAFDIPNRAEDIYYGVVIDNGSFKPPDRAGLECLESPIVGLDETVASPSCSQVTTELEDPGRRTCSVDVEIHKDTETVNNVGESCSPYNAMVSSDACLVESPGGPEVVNDETQSSMEPKDTDHSLTFEHMATKDRSVLQPCNSSRQSDMSLLRGEHGHDVNETKLVSGKSLTSDRALSGVTLDAYRKFDEEMDNAASCDNFMVNLDRSATSVPAPEKLLSASEGLAFGPNNLLAEMTPDNEVLEGNNGDGAGIELLSGKKRSFTESTLTVHSLNSVESPDVTISRRTVESIPDDDDLLSSILVGRKSSVMKTKPPSLASEIKCRKRLRSAPRATTSKKKVLMDDMMVLHGDMIRQQLTNTEDIRRMRKKAPCTRPEISMIRRQFVDEEIFNEPIFTGLSEALVPLHGETFDLSRISVSEDDQDKTSVETTKDVDSSVMRNDTEVLPAVSYVQIECQLGESHDFRSSHETMEEIAIMEIDVDNTGIADAAADNVHGLELLSDPISGDVSNMPDDCVAQSSLMDDVDASLQMDTRCLSPEKLDAQSVEDVSLANISVEGGHDVAEVECKAETRGNDHGADVTKPFHDSLATGSPKTARCDNLVFVNGDQPVERTENNNPTNVNGDEVMKTYLGGDDMDTTYIAMQHENKDSTFFSEADVKVVSSNVGENVDYQEADLQYVKDIQISPGDRRPDFEDVTVANDTEFLNVDDDEVPEEDNDDIAGAEDTHVQENTGWSSRTRAVAKYLQILFDKEEAFGRKVLPLDQLLAGKTRKEASRMFFESLVLKTKDYINVEQPKPFDNINIKARTKLVKSDF